MAQALLKAQLEARNPNVEVFSAGFLSQGTAADKKVVWALERLGLDASEHLSQKVGSALERNPDLVLVMAREHLRGLAKLNPGVVAKAFTLKEFVFLATIEGPRRKHEPLSDYLSRVGVSRGVGAMTSPGTELDVEDPIGKRRKAFARCAAELQELVGQTADLLYPDGRIG